jgi:Glycosyl hydrolases family 6
LVISNPFLENQVTFLILLPPAIHPTAALACSQRPGNPLIDAYLWVKIPGESDGECTRGRGPTGTVDPEWGIVDPGARQWFPEMALELAQNANPPLP